VLQIFLAQGIKNILNCLAGCLFATMFTRNNVASKHCQVSKSFSGIVEAIVIFLF
jgi:MFS superfamily sulfate permease-like transporter